MPPPYQGRKLRLDKNCIFVQLDKEGDPEPRSVVYRHTQKPPHQITHYTPLNDSARLVLDLLARNAGKGTKNKGTLFEDIRDQLIQSFAVTLPVAEEALNAFLNELEGNGLLEEPPDYDHIPLGPYRHQGDVHGQIIEGGTSITVGYQINWYRP